MLLVRKWCETALVEGLPKSFDDNHALCALVRRNPGPFFPELSQISDTSRRTPPQVNVKFMKAAGLERIWFRFWKRRGKEGRSQRRGKTSYWLSLQFSASLRLCVSKRAVITRSTAGAKARSVERLETSRFSAASHLACFGIHPSYSKRISRKGAKLAKFYDVRLGELCAFARIFISARIML